MKRIISLATLLMLSLCAFAQENAEPEYGYKQTDFQKGPKVGAFIIGSYKYSDAEGAETGPGFGVRLIRAYVDGSIYNDFKYRLQVEINGTPHVKDFYLEWAKYSFFSVKMGQFKRAFTFENPYNPWDVGVGDYSLLVKKLAGMGDYCGEASMGGRDLGIQVQGDFMPIGEDKHNLFHYQLGLYNGNGINKVDNNSQKDLIGTFQVQPIKDLYIGVFGWKGNWSDGNVTVDRNRISAGFKYEHNFWTARAEWAKGFGHRVSDYDEATDTWNGTGEADAFYATIGVPVKNWLKVYAKMDQYRSQATSETAHSIYSLATNFRLHKNLNFQIEYRHHNDKTLASPNYNEIWFQSYVRF